MVIRLVKEMPITLRMDSSSLNPVSKTLEINRMELVRMVNSHRTDSKVNNLRLPVVGASRDSRVSLDKVLILAVIVDSKASKMVVVHRARDKMVRSEIRPEVINLEEMEVHKVSKMTMDLRHLHKVNLRDLVTVRVIILMAIMTERKLLKML